MTLALVVAIVAPFVGVVFLLREELSGIYHALTDSLSNGLPPLHEALASIPWLGERLQEMLERLGGDPKALAQQLGEWARQWSGELTGLVGDIGRNLLKLGIALLALFFVYRDGEALVDQVQRVLERFLGARGSAYLHAVAATTRGVVYGVVLTALAQGLLAGLGYWVAAVPAPASLGVFTALLALVPFGAPLVWVPAGLWLILDGALLSGVGLLVWGGLVVSSVDNIIRPLAISSATRVPFLLVMLGVIGGLRAFGLVGLFLGPTILAVLLAVWREWLEESRGRDAATASVDNESVDSHTETGP
jgi:predicted PurR-regulated permease PerM